MPIAESRCDYDTNIIRRFARSIKFYSVPIGPVSFLIVHACSEFRSPEIRGEERRGHRPVAKIEEEARKRKKKKEKGKEKANGKIEKQEGRCEGTEKARDKGEADTQDACVDTLRPSPSPSCSSVESKYVDRRRAHD